ncbi:MAG: hypothetical protein IPI07_15070 [Flavobacteriales bacterium]|nr:hypothetical protein [Flavobacteriales bacterium]
MFCRSSSRSVLLVALLVCVIAASAQSDEVAPSDTARYRIVLDDQSLLTGVIDGSDAGVMRIRTDAMGIVSIPMRRIVRMERIEAGPSAPEDTRGGEVPRATRPARRILPSPHPPLLPPPLPLPHLDDQKPKGEGRWFRERHAGRYFAGPAAFPLKAGEGYHRNTCFVLQSAAVGVTDHIAVSGGFELLSVAGFSRQAPGFHLGAKAAWKLHRYVHFGLSAAYTNTPTEYRFFDRYANYHPVIREGNAAAFGMVTIGTDRYHGTLGGGVRYHEWKGLEETPSFSLGLAARVIPKLWVIGETWLVGEEESFTPWWSMGVRFASRAVAVDFGVVNNEAWYKDVFVGVPMVSCCINFGHRWAKAL